MNTENEKKYPTYVSKDNANCEKQVILLMISKREGYKTNIHGQWHYLVVKKLSALLRGITSKNHGDSYCLNCLYFFTTEKNVSCIQSMWKERFW